MDYRYLLGDTAQKVGAALVPGAFWGKRRKARSLAADSQGPSRPSRVGANGTNAGTIRVVDTMLPSLSASRHSETAQRADTLRRWVVQTLGQDPDVRVGEDRRARQDLVERSVAWPSVRYQDACAVF